MKIDTGSTLSITWLGHAAFLIAATDGPKILLDPYRAPDAGSYGRVDVPAQIVLVSHLNPKYHSHWEAASGTPLRLNGLDFAGSLNGIDAHGIRFRAIQVWESEARTVPVSMPYFEVGGLTLCHSGDLGHALTPGEAAPIHGIDIFLAVAGGPPTVSLPDLKASLDLIQPRMVIPMHYQNGKVNLPLRPVNDFLSLFDDTQIIRHPEPTLELSKDVLPDKMRVVVLPSAL